MRGSLRRRLSAAVALVSLLLGGCVNDNIPPYHGSSGMTGQPLSPTTAEEFAAAVEGVWTFGTASPYASLALTGKNTYVLCRKVEAGQAGEYVAAGAYTLANDLRTIELGGFGKIETGAITTEQMAVSIEEGASRYDARMFRQKLSPEESFIGLKVGSVAFYDEEDGPAVTKHIFVYDGDGRLSSLTEIDLVEGIEARLGFDMSDSRTLAISGETIVRNGAGAHKIPVSATVSLNAAGLAERVTWSAGTDSAAAIYVYTGQGFLNTTALLETRGGFVSGMTTLYAADGASQAFANGKDGNTFHTYTYDTGHRDDGNYLASMYGLFANATPDRWLAIGGWLGRGPRRPLLRSDLRTNAGESYVRYEYTYPETGHVNYAETAVITKGSAGGEIPGGILRPHYYSEGREDAVETVPRTKDELLGQLAGVWEFPKVSPYLSLELDTGMNYTITAEAASAETEEDDGTTPSPRIWSGTYSVAGNLQFIMLDGFGRIRVDRITADGIRLTIMPDESLGIGKQTLTATAAGQEEPDEEAR